MTNPIIDQGDSLSDAKNNETGAESNNNRVLRGRELRQLCLQWVDLAIKSSLMLLILSVMGVNPVSANEIKVAVASSLSSTLILLAKDFQTKTGHSVRLSFGSSGNFTRQIERGAPYDLFISANNAYVLRLVNRGAVSGAKKVIGIGRLALFYPAGGKLKKPVSLDHLKTAIESGEVRRFSIANPEHAPFGHAARQVLQKIGAWGSVKSKLIIGENAAQASRFVAMGSVDAGLIPQSLALSPELAIRGSSSLVPQSMHDSLTVTAMVVKASNKTAGEFVEFLLKESSQLHLKRQGFDPAPMPAARG